MNKKIRSVFVSDVHLGTTACKYEYLLDFLKNIECEFLYLNGDIIDLWAIIRKGSFLTQEHINVIRKILSLAKKGTKIKYILGNHEDHLRKYHNFDEPIVIGNIEIANEFVHTKVNGDKIWVVHGDLYDTLVKNYRWISILGDISYGWLIWFNTIFNKIRIKFGYKYWSLSQVVKENVKQAVSYVFEYEKIITTECKKKDFYEVCTGHIHVPVEKEIDGVKYWNCGDFVENNTAIIEYENGEMILYHHVLQ